MTDETPITVLLAEDDETLARLTAMYLAGHQVTTHCVANGLEVVAAALRLRPDVVVLDLMLPGLDGLEVCRRLRRHVDVPILMVTARGDEVDRVIGLEGGADDYVVKPVSSRELLARIRAQVRRARGALVAVAEVVDAGPLRLDRRTRRATLDGLDLALTTYEFELLLVLAARPGRVLAREQLVELVRGSADQAFDRSIDVHVSRLRQKLRDDPRNPRLLKTVRGVGYMLAIV